MRLPLHRHQRCQTLLACQASSLQYLGSRHQECRPRRRFQLRSMAVTTNGKSRTKQSPGATAYGSATSMKRRSLLSQRVQQATAGQQGHGTDAEGSLSREQDDAYHQAELMAKVQAMMKTAAEAEARERSSACTAPTVKEEQAEGESDSEEVDVDAEEAAEAEAMLAASMAALDAAEEDDKRVEEGFAPGVSAEEQESYLSWAYRRLTDLTAYEIPAMGSYSAEDDIMMGAEAAMAGAESAPTSAPASRACSCACRRSRRNSRAGCTARSIGYRPCDW